MWRLIAALAAGATIAGLLLLRCSQREQVGEMIAQQEFSGEAARDRLLRLCHGNVPTQTADVYVFDGGSFNGSIIYCAVTCPSNEECWRIAEGMSPGQVPQRREFGPWRRPSFAVVAEGPRFYYPMLKAAQWDVGLIQHGWTYEQAEGDRRLTYCAIDSDRHRVFYHYESGGFPAKLAR